ncbi:DEKNAAC100785 [Brettanomyces naardenensis]|uniref:DEKNAAC100785 n=1 Tax=Brettanomyces naardenensis TaxID=13370 RepID=A0A448YGF7_BRENA|nr:DEKNAAC100785 [Brettanomyces naardenensis]
MSDETVKSILYPDDPTPIPRRAPTELLERSTFDLFSLKGKICVVTGAARAKGIGYAAAEAYCEAGAKGLAIWDYNDPSEAAETLSRKYGTDVRAYRVDVSKNESVKAAVDKVLKDFGTIDVFVANAGVVWETGTILNMETDDDVNWHHLMDVDLNGVYYCAKHVGRVFKEHKTGSLVITASMSGLIVNFPNLQTPYNVAKAACINMAKSLAVEFAPFNARVNCVCPGYMDTGLSDFLPQKTLNTWAQLIPAGRQGLNKELAGAYLYLATDAASYTTGAALVVDGGYTCP